MGGVPVLLMVAALGVDYGWQPDGGDGVEYVIQVPPEQWNRVRELGEISSVIDPEVQGRVSRVIIRVGNETLPRVAPPRASTQGGAGSQSIGNSAIAANDLVPMPIPEMSGNDTRRPIPGGYAVADASSSQSESVMKPDPNDSAAPGGFALPPSMQDAANNAASAVRGAADQFKNDLSNAAQSNFDSALNQLRPTEAQTQDAIGRMTAAARDAVSPMLNPNGPSTAPASQPTVNQLTQADPSQLRNQVPAFTGGNDAASAMARTRAGGPSTDPASPNSANWYPLGTAPAATSNSTTVTPPSPTTINRYANTQTAASGQQPTAQSQQPATQPQQPSAFATPNTTAVNPNATMSNPSLSGNGNFGRVPDSLRSSTGYAADPNTNPYATNNTNNPAQTYTPPAATNTNTGLGYSNTPYANTQPTYNATQDPYANSRSNTFPPNAYDFDPRLTAAERANLPSGAFSYNAQGLPVDREGRVVGPYATTNAPVYAQNQTPSGYTNWNNPANPGFNSTNNFTPTNGYAQQTAPQVNVPYTRDSLSDPQTRLATNNQSGNFGDRATSSNASTRSYTQPEDDLTSNSDLGLNRTTSGLPPTSRSSLTPRPTVAAQPFFNGLLLLSIVANVYLIFWLKNLRQQFRDLVAAKRMSQSSAAMS